MLMYKAKRKREAEKEKRKKKKKTFSLFRAREFPPHRLGDGRRRRRLWHGGAPRQQRRAEHPVVEGQGPAQDGQRRGRGRERELPDERLTRGS